MGCPIERSCRASRGLVLARLRQDLHQFLLRHRQRVNEGLHRRLAVAPAALMRSLLIVLDEPGVEIGLQLIDPPVALFSERHAVELIRTLKPTGVIGGRGDGWHLYSRSAAGSTSGRSCSRAPNQTSKSEGGRGRTFSACSVPALNKHLISNHVPGGLAPRRESKVQPISIAYLRVGQ